MLQCCRVYVTMRGHYHAWNTGSMRVVLYDYYVSRQYYYVGLVPRLRLHEGLQSQHRVGDILEYRWHGV